MTSLRSFNTKYRNQPRCITARISAVVCVIAACSCFAAFAPRHALANTAAGCGENAGNTACAASNDNTQRSAPDPGSAESARQPSVMVGNPINLITGNKYQNDTDIQLTSTRLAWQRHYNSANAQYDFGLGRGWSATFLATLQSINKNGASLVQSNGRRVVFNQPEKTTRSDGTIQYTWNAITPSDGTLRNEGDYVHWSLPDGRTLRFKGPFLVEIDFPGPAQLTLFYKENRLIRVTDEYGQHLQFSYYEPTEALVDFDAIQQQQQLLDDNGRPIFGSAIARLKTLTQPDGQTIQYDYDTSGNLTRVRYPDNTSRVYHYEHSDYTSHLTGVTDRRGIRTNTWDYDEQGYAIRSERANGVERTDLQYDLPPIIGGTGYTHITNSLGEQSTYTWQRYPQHGQSLLLASDGAGCTSCPPVGRTYTYTDDFLLLELRHTSGGGVRWEYDEFGRTTASFGIGTDGSERLIKRLSYADTDTDGDGDNNSDASLSTRPAVIHSRSINPADERSTGLTYNAEGQPVVVTEHGYKPIVTDNNRSNPASAPTVVGYEPIVRTTRLEYENGRLVKIDGPREDVDDHTVFQYQDNTADINKKGYLKSIQLPGGQLLSFSDYNVFGQPTTIQRNQASPHELTYDANQRLIAVTHRGNTLTYHYDAEGRVTGTTDVNGQHTRLSYDDAGRLIEIGDKRGSELQWVYDTESRRTGAKQYGFDGSEIRNLALIYDTLGRLTQQVETRTNHSTGSDVFQQTDLTRNAVGQITATTNPATGLSLTYERNPFGELLAFSTPFIETSLEQGADGDQPTNPADLQAFNVRETTTRITQDALGHPNTVTDARENTTTYIRDDFGNTIAEHHPDTGASLYERDVAGNPVSKTNADGNTTHTSFDAANRPLTKANRDGVTTFDYDPVSGKLIKAANPATTETFNYNPDGELTAHTREIDGHRFSSTYAYDQRGRLDRKGLPDGTQLRYHYYPDQQGSQPNSNSIPTNAGQLKAITRESLLGLRQETLIGEIDTDPSDGRTGHISHNGTVTERHFHPDGTLRSITSSDGLQLQYSYDDEGRITGIDRDGTLETYQYLNGHLVSAQNARQTLVYQYDQLGNRLKKSTLTVEDETTRSSTENYTYADNGRGNRLLSTSGSNSDGDFKYTSSGAPTRTNLYRYIYNNDQRPTQVFEGDKLLAEYRYNSFGERVKKVTYNTSGKSATFFLYDRSRLTTEIRLDVETQTVKTIYQTIYLGFSPTVYLKDRATYSIHSDHLGTPWKLSDKTGRTVWQTTYSPFGKSYFAKNDVEFNHRLPGQYHDSETGLHSNYYREYDPEDGRYLQSDPTGITDGPNTYLYVAANPIMYADPLGLARFGFRPLAGMEVLFDPNEIPNGIFNHHAAHEQLWFDDNPTENIGFFSGDGNDRGPAICGENGDVRTDIGFTRNDYYFHGPVYDDNLMRQALNNIRASWDNNTYCLLGRNCQHFADALRDEYERLANPPNCRLTRRGIRCN